ncbi:hypothetical protein B0H11DRAFT_2272277 [Mycena galericulata]|nr:hypothetical protein B0H11DRAFT_2272277 [Mycena galericulata]
MSTLEFDAQPPIGALQIGALFAVCLFGGVTAQVSLYYTRFPTDHYLLKCLVALVWSLDLSHTVAICHALYTITVIQYGHPEFLVIAPNSLNLSILLSGFIGPLEQGWLAYRMYKFSKSCYLPMFCMLLSASRAAGSIALATIAFRRMPILAFVSDWGWLIECVLVVGVVTDLILVIALCYHLSTWRGEGFIRMNRLVNRLMQWAIGTIPRFLTIIFNRLSRDGPDDKYGGHRSAYIFRDHEEQFWIAVSCVTKALLKLSSSVVKRTNTDITTVPRTSSHRLGSEPALC